MRPHRSAARGPARLLAATAAVVTCAGLAAVPPLAGTPASAAPAPPPPPPRAATPIHPFTWPLHPRPEVARRFSAPPHPYGPGHRGVDLAAGVGQQVHAAAAGTVVFAGMVAGRPVVSVDHPGGLRTTYEPVEPAVRAGEVLTAGTALGTVAAGHPGCPAPACLHWGVRSAGGYLDPLRAWRVRLKPVSR